MDNQNVNNKNIINNSNHYNNNIYMNTGAETTGAVADGKTHYLSNNHLSPDYNGTGGQAHTRRRSSAYLGSAQLDSCRRLSAVSGHSIAMAMDIKRKSHMEGEGHREGDSIDVPEHEQMSFTMKCVYTSIMMLIHHNFGLSVSGFAPSYVDWTVMLRTNMTYIGLIPIFQAIGGICGSVCGTLYKWLPRQLVLLFVVILMAMATVFMPYSTEIWHLYICIFFYGCGVGAWNNSNNVWLIEMWQKRSPTMLLLSQGIYGVGTILGPMVVKPYLSGISQSDKMNDNMNDTMAALLASQVSDKLKTPFLITGCIEVIGPIIMLALFFIKPYKFTSLTKREDEMAVTEADKTRLEEERRVIPKKTLIVCTAIFFATGFMTENMYVDFAPSYFQFVPNLQLSAQTAADIASTMAIALAGGRFLCILLAMKLRPQYMIFIHVCIIWVGVLVQYFGQDILGVLWFSAALICYGYSCIYVTLYAFVNQYFEMTDAVGTIFIMCYNSLYLFLPYIIGDNIEQTPDIFNYLMFACVSISIVDFAFILFKIRNIPKHLIRL